MSAAAAYVDVLHVGRRQVTFTRGDRDVSVRSTVGTYRPALCKHASVMRQVLPCLRVRFDRVVGKVTNQNSRR